MTTKRLELMLQGCVTVTVPAGLEMRSFPTQRLTERLEEVLRDYGTACYMGVHDIGERPAGDEQEGKGP